MVGRNKNWIGHSSWMNEFNRVHNPEYYYGEKKIKKKIEKKNQKQKDTPPKFKIFRK
jgi:hypothetical protein